jgi:tetratricopeptide (TPR) repeat protein
VTTPNAGLDAKPASHPPTSPPARPRRLDRRYLGGCVTGLLLGGALGVPGAYALLRFAGEARPCAEGPSREERDAMLALGLRALSQKDATRALEIFRQMASVTPGDAAIHNNICVALNELGRYEEAVASCKDALDLAPGYVLAKSNLAWARAQRDRSPSTPGAATTP